jgi:hypothetical protein
LESTREVGAYASFEKLASGHSTPPDTLSPILAAVRVRAHEDEGDDGLRVPGQAEAGPAADPGATPSLLSGSLLPT